MGISLLTLEKSKVDFKEVKSFCDQQISEGLKVEYKRDFPKNEDMAKSVCAFANTEGGIILIGAEANKERNVPTDIPGISMEKGLEEKVSSICLSHILPRITPEVKLCPFNLPDDRQRAVLFILHPPWDIYYVRGRCFNSGDGVIIEGDDVAVPV